MTAERGLTFLDATLADPLCPPASQLLVFGIFNFFLRNVKVVSNTRGSANTIEEAGQYFFGGGEEREARTTTRHSLGPRAEASVGIQMGVGWLPARSLGRESQAHLHTRHTQPGMHALHPLLSSG